MSKYLKTAYRQGTEARERGFERQSPYRKCLAEMYWNAGYDGLEFKQINNALKEQRREIKSKLGYSRIGLGNV